MSPNEDPVMAEVAAIRRLLEQVIRDRGFTHVAVQDAVGWKGSYLSQVFREGKHFRVEHIFRGLSVIGLEPAEFFSLHYRHTGVKSLRDHQVDLFAMAASESLNALLRYIESPGDEGLREIRQTSARMLLSFDRLLRS